MYVVEMYIWMCVNDSFIYMNLFEVLMCMYVVAVYIWMCVNAILFNCMLDVFY